MIIAFIEGLIKLIGGRKAALTITVLAIGASIDLLTARGLSENMLMLLLGVSGTFVAGNVGATFAYSQIVKHQAPEAPATSSPEVEVKLRGLDNRVTLLTDEVKQTARTVATLGQIVLSSQPKG